MTRVPPLHITVETIACDESPQAAIVDLCDLADRIGIWVLCDVNGYSAFVCPGADRDEEVSKFEAALK